MIKCGASPIILILFFLIAATSSLFSQNVNESYLQGFDREVSGKRFTYHSPFPEITSCLLVRGREDFEPISWYTETVPFDFDGEFVSFIWVFAMDVVADPVEFKLTAAGRQWFSFQNSRISEIGERSIAGPEGAQLRLNITMVDHTDDQMGFAVMKLPITAVTPGSPVRVEVSAIPSENDAWFISYDADLKEKIDIYQNNVVVRGRDKPLHSISVDIVHLGDDQECGISIGDATTRKKLQPGFNRVEVLLPKAEIDTEHMARIEIGASPIVEKSFILSPVREWEVLLVQHTHSDIGYTRPQTEILPEHLRYIDHALDYCDQTDHFPDDAKFRWTCETSWSVREYLRSRPQAQINRLLERLREGRIEATGMFFNFSEIIDESALAAQTRTLKILKEQGIEVRTAMQNDVNGVAWSLIDYFDPIDVKYLTMGIHAHRARRPFDKPTSFWWQSPSGNRMLTYRSEHYQHGNALTLTSGQQDVLRDRLSAYLTSLENRKYPYDKISLQFSGYITDNSPPSTKVCKIIKEWNEKYEWPKLRNALASEFMVFLDQYHADEIPQYEVAWPDWWTDGVGSAANETKEVRRVHTEINTSTCLLAMAKMLGQEIPDDIYPEIETVYDNLMFYDEHTHGAAESVTDPLAENTINQWGMKSSYAWEAAKRSSALQEKALSFLEPAFKKGENPTIAVVNTLNWTRSGSVDLFIDFETLPDGVPYTIVDAQGNIIPSQVNRRREEGAYYTLWVENIPPVGYKTLEIRIGSGDFVTGKKPETSKTIENDFYRIIVEGRRGVLSSIFDKKLQMELIDQNDTLVLGQMIYEQLDNRHEMERLTNTNRDTIYRPLGMSRSFLSNISYDKSTDGPIYRSIFLHGDMPVCADERGVSIELRLFHFEKRIDLLYKMYKLQHSDPEGVYVAFPFKLEGGQLAFEAQGGVVYPGQNQLGGSAADWNTIQHFAAVRGKGGQIVFVSPQIPLVQFGGINTGRYYYRHRPLNNHIYSWVLNNYWVTNFKASQQGELRWSYTISSVSDSSDMAATKIGWGRTTPLISRVLLPKFGSQTTRLEERSLIDLNAPDLLLVDASISMDGSGVILHVREVGGNQARVSERDLKETTGAKSVNEVNILEEAIAKDPGDIFFQEFETKFIRLDF